MVVINYKTKTCKTCGKEFTPNSGVQTYCYDCAPKAARSRARLHYLNKIKHPCPMCGQLCKGKICKQCTMANASNRYRDIHGGYIVLRIRDHPMANKKGIVAEHRFVMADYLGRFLTKDEVVHHLNGIRHDNRIQNLGLVTKHSHPSKTYIKILQKRIRDLEAQLSQQRF